MTNESKRYWCFTINNYTDVDKQQLNTLCNDVSYLCYGYETGKENDTPHLQGYIELTRPQRFSWIKKRLSRAYLAIRKGSRTQARDYCFKECTEPFEHGTWVPDRQGMRNDLVSMKRKIDEGTNEIDLWEEHFGSMLRYHRGMNRYAALKRKRLCREVKIVWIYGPSGHGKTRYCFDKYPNAYWKPNSKWWDMYDGEDVVIWDDFSMSGDYSYTTLLKWCDRYPKTGETKGSTTNLNYHTLVFTSVDHPRFKIPSFDEQLERRIDVVNITHVTSSQNC